MSLVSDYVQDAMLFMTQAFFQTEECSEIYSSSALLQKIFSSSVAVINSNNAGASQLHQS